MPYPPKGLDRWNWYKIEPLTFDEFQEQSFGPWLFAESVQAAYRKGQKDEAEEHFQREWETRQKQQAAQPTSAEAASIERLKGMAR